MRSPIPYILIILGIGIGLLITAQWKTSPKRSVNPIGPYLALQQTDRDLINEQLTLKNDIAMAQKNIDLETSLAKNDATSKAIAEQIQALKEKIGLTDKRGTGVVVTLDDSARGSATADTISHAADLRDIINVLWKNGAQAISINNERVVLNTSIDCIVNTILINNTKTTPPYTISAIGDSRQLSSALKNAANLPEIAKRVKNEGLIFTIRSKWILSIPAFNGSFDILYASKESR